MIVLVLYDSGGKTTVSLFYQFPIFIVVFDDYRFLSKNGLSYIWDAQTTFFHSPFLSTFFDDDRVDEGFLEAFQKLVILFSFFRKWRSVYHEQSNTSSNLWRS